ncbi:OmpA family protein [Reichenbachiella carrageenanivorans]|uniref:OmpA family protein n=1 Tax=Reichenbachiella carrageenanivorans TaxID=2979869 RepID=A0ABY6D1R2_9BACT|nr:OmpA family protein [Reichenbachiella carrageenanivorans]UXX77795.1 OmpA family protein [Reichenbachiella carrageenanivorans]
MIKFLSQNIFFLLSLLVLTQASSHAQFLGKKKDSHALLQIDTLGTEGNFSIYNFKNINVVNEYYDKGKMHRIQKLEQEKNWAQLYPLLQDYVMQFGIRNFYVDTYWIWRLAKLTEVYGTEGEARSLYKLALRHHHQRIDIREIELYYDSLNTQEVDNFVPLDYYYKLVEHRKAIDTIRPPRGVLLNMGRKINSRQADYAPTLGMNNQALIFTSKRNEQLQNLSYRKNEDLFISRKVDGYWDLSTEMREINTRYNEGSACISKDGQTLFFSRCESPGSMGNCDLFMAKLGEDSVWTDIENLGFTVNSVSWDSHPSLSHTEDTLYFASDRIGGFGLSDIYFTYRNGKGEWMPAQNLGPVINTRQNEVSPFYHPNYQVLFFSSNGQLFKFGEFDIYKSYHNDNQWSEPINIGPLVNGRGSEFYFSIDSDSKDLFYARSATQDLNLLDLYSFPLPMEAQPEALTKITGSLTDSLTGKPFTGIVSVIDLDEGTAVAPKYLKPDGSFEFDLINHRNYLLIIQGDEFFRIEEMFYLDGPAQFDEVTEPIASKVKFESIEFDAGQANLKVEMYGDLNKIINFMYDNPDFYLRISGHTDKYGSDQLNLQLSKDRAQTIRDYIVIFGGVASNRVENEGYGSTQPIVEEVTVEDRKLNRRVEFEIYRPAIQKEQDIESQFEE